jgi:hypothetical protein
MEGVPLLLPKRLLAGLAVGFVGAFLFLALAYLLYRPSVDQVSSDDEVYEVYSATLRDLFLKGRETKGHDDLGINLVVGDHTSSFQFTEWVTLEKSLDWASTGVIVDNRTIVDFAHKCTESIPLEPRFTLPAKLVLISHQDLLFPFDNGDYWTAFYQRYPNSQGIIAVSRVGFNPKRNQALLCLAQGCGNLCGEGYYVLLTKDRGAWSVRHQVMSWVS